MVKDLSWLWRAAYNLAVDSCSAWGGTNERTARLFGLAVEVRVSSIRLRQISPFFAVSGALRQGGHRRSRA
jgi:hypothetical protein